MLGSNSTYVVALVLPAILSWVQRLPSTQVCVGLCKLQNCPSELSAA